MRKRRLWVVSLLLFIALFWIYQQFLPAFVERLINRVDDHPEWVIDERARTHTLL